MVTLLASMLFALPITVSASASAASAADATADVTDAHVVDAWIADKVATAEATARAIAAAEIERVPLNDYLVLLQRNSCAQAHGELDRGPGARCMAKPVADDPRDGAEDEDVQLCAANGGVLIKRTAACTAASAALVHLYRSNAQEAEISALLQTFTDMARFCWGRTLCVE